MQGHCQMVSRPALARGDSTSQKTREAVKLLRGAELTKFELLRFKDRIQMEPYFLC